MRIKNILIIVLISAVILLLSALFLILPDQPYSFSERRSLAGKPLLSAEKLADGRFMEEFEAYTLDQFPGREKLRTLKALAVQYLFAQKDNNGLYRAGGYLSKLEYPLSEARMSKNLGQLTAVYESFLAPSDCRVYYSVIPDKNSFLGQRYGYPYIECGEMADRLGSALPGAVRIDISGALSLESFYETDQHWKQEQILAAAKTLSDAMGAEPLREYEVCRLETPFYGTYAGQSALPCRPDTICYIRNAAIDSCTAVTYRSGKAQPALMYDREKASGKDPYEMFLGGADPLIEISNPLCGSGRELIIFRDSFGSSLAPLMVDGYSKITLIDLRYMKSSLLPEYVSFDDQDVLFLYSTLILNNNIAS